MKEVAVPDRHFERPAYPDLEYYRKLARGSACRAQGWMS